MRCLLALLAALSYAGMTPVGAQEAPRVDHHQHLFSPALAALLSPPAPATQTPPITAQELVAHLDAAGIERAVVLSAAYIFEQPTRGVEDAAATARRENDWVRSVSQDGNRLRVNVALVRASDEARLWSTRFDRTMNDIFAIQDEISRGIVDVLRMKLGGGPRHCQADLEAYGLYLRGRHADEIDPVSPPTES